MRKHFKENGLQTFEDFVQNCNKTIYSFHIFYAF